MKRIHAASMAGACSERQVLVYPANWQDPSQSTIEEIKISIVNDRATGTKRKRDEGTAVTPCAKMSHLADFSCSTSSSASVYTAQQSDFPDGHPLGQNTQQEELDDSLLDPSDDEDDSEWPMTELDDSLLDLSDDDDEVSERPMIELDDSILDLSDDDGDSCYAAEPQGKYEMTTSVVTVTTSELENEGENGGASHCTTLNTSDTLTEEPESEGDVGNYAAMPLSPCQSATDSIEVIKPKQSSVCNVNSLEFLTAKTVMASDPPAPLSDMKEVPASVLPCSGSPARVSPSVSLYGVDDAVDWSEDPDLAFDCDIDNVLTISPMTDFSLEDDNGVESAAVTTKGNSSIISSDSTLPPPNAESDKVLYVNVTCSDASDTAQVLPPLYLNTAGLPRVHHHHPPAEPEPSSTSSVITSESKRSTKSPGTEQNVEPQNPSKVEEIKGVLKAESTLRSTDPSPSAAPRSNGNQSKIVAPSHCKAKGSLDAENEKPLIAVSPRTSFRASLKDLELIKNGYCEQVLMHIEGHGECNLEDPRSELASLQNHISWENQDWQHPSNFTKRNHPRFGNRPSKCCTLQQWVAKNGGPGERFKNIPATFQRKPIPGSLPLSS